MTKYKVSIAALFAALALVVASCSKDEEPATPYQPQTQDQDQNQDQSQSQDDILVTVTMPDGEVRELTKGDKIQIPDTVKESDAIYLMYVGKEECSGQEIQVWKDITIRKVKRFEMVGDKMFKLYSLNEFAGDASLDTITTDVYVKFVGLLPSDFQSKKIDDFYNTRATSNIAWALSCHSNSKAALHIALDGVGLNTIAGYAFYHVENNIAEVILPSSILFLDKYAFAYSSVGSIVIPDNIPEIPEYAFYQCKLKNVVIGKGVKNINEYAFAYSDLEEVDIPGTVETIEGAFWDCRKLKKVTMHEGTKSIHNTFVGTAIETIDIPESLTELGNGSFFNCKYLKEIYIPKNVTRISNQLFDECINLKKVTIANGPTSIAYNAFHNTAIETIRIPSSVEKIDAKAFDGCKNLTLIEIDNSKENVAINNGYIYYKIQYLK